MFHDTKPTSVCPSNLQRSFRPRRFDASQPLTFLSPSRLHLGVGFLSPTFFQDGVTEPSLHRLISVKRTSLEQTRNVFHRKVPFLDVEPLDSAPCS